MSSDDETPLLELAFSSGSTTLEEIQEINEEFNKSWSNEESSPPNTTNTITSTPPINMFATPPMITVAQVKHAIANPVVTIEKHEELKAKRLEKVKRLKRLNSKITFQNELNQLQNTFKDPTVAKKRATRITANKNISYWEGSQ